MSEKTARCEKLVQWVLSNGGLLNPDVELVEGLRQGLHIRASRDLGIAKPASNEVTICMCPSSLTLSHLNVMPPEPGKAVRHVDSPLSILLEQGLPESTVAHFFLVEQRLLGEQSFWEPYISCLPGETQLTTPLYFSDKDKQWLAGTNVFSAIDGRREAWQKNWQSGCEALSSSGIDVSKYTWELYQWAATIFSSRSFTSNAAFPGSGGFPLLYPLVDSLNHRVGAKMVWRFDNGSFSLNTTEAIKAGDEIYNNYAPKSNGELLMGYGFCIPSNPCDEVSIRLGRLPPPVVENLQRAHPAEVTDPSDLTFDLRSKSHYSRYPSPFPYLRDIPPLMFRAILELVLFSRGSSSLSVDFAKPPGRLVLAGIRQLLVPLTHKRAAITSSMPATPPSNTKQQIAKIYREGQAQILSDIISELQSVVLSLLPTDVAFKPAHQAPASGIFTFSYALSLLTHAHGAASAHFVEGLEAALGARDPAGLREADVEDAAWMLWLCVAYACSGPLLQSQPQSREGSAAQLALASYVADLLFAYPLDAVDTEGQAESIAYLSQIRAAAAQAAQEEGGTDGGVWDESRWAERVMAWAAEVVATEAWQMGVPGPEGEAEVAWVMYLRREEAEERWVRGDMQE